MLGKELMYSPMMRLLNTGIQYYLMCLANPPELLRSKQSALDETMLYKDVKEFPVFYSDFH